MILPMSYSNVSGPLKDKGKWEDALHSVTILHYAKAMLGDSGAQCCSLGFATRSSAYRCNISLQSVALCGFRAFWPGHLPTFMRVRAENWADWRGRGNLQLALVSLDLWANKNLHKLAKYRPNFCQLSPYNYIILQCSKSWTRASVQTPEKKWNKNVEADKSLLPLLLLTIKMTITS